MTTTALKATLLPYDPQSSSHTPIFTHIPSHTHTHIVYVCVCVHVYVCMYVCMSRHEKIGIWHLFGVGEKCVCVCVRACVLVHEAAYAF